MAEALALLLVAGFAVVFIMWPRNKGEWHPTPAPWRKSARYIDGSKIESSHVWGRKINGRWQYRPMTNAEYNSAIGDILA